MTYRSSTTTTSSGSLYGGYKSTAQRAASVYGSGVGNRGVRVSYASNSTSGGYGLGVDNGGFMGASANDKATMQNLNDRLSTYLDKVRSLESANSQLERQIREWYEKRTPQIQDYSKYEAIVADLRRKINMSYLDNARILLQIDNAKLASEDFQMKYDNELIMRQSTETDVLGLRKVLDDLTISRTDLEMQLEGLKEELIYLKKNHQEELAALRCQVNSGSVNVEVEAGPQQDLSLVMDEIRRQYEVITEKNRKDTESWYNVKFEELNKEVASSVDTLKFSRSQITELKRTLQSLQIELQSQLSLKSALENQLGETESRYNIHLNQLQVMVNNLEEQLGQVKMDIDRQGQEYKLLLDIKTRLEMEIAEYRRLLDGEAVTQTVVVTPVKREPVVTKRIKYVVEKIVDGKVVSRTEDTDEAILQN